MLVEISKYTYYNHENPLFAIQKAAPLMTLSVHAMPGHLIRRLQQHSTHQFTRQMQSAGIDLTSVQFAAMDAIAQKADQDQAQIARKIAYDRATIGGVMARLEQKGLIERKIAAHDRRARTLALTPLGVEALETARPVVIALQQDILNGLSADEQDSFMQLAQKILAAAPDD